MIRIIDMDEKPFQEGHAAYTANLGEDQNPYDETLNPADWEVWLEGYKEAREEYFIALMR